MRFLCGDSLEILRTIESESAQTCVTSPPYWGLRDYGVSGQMGLERTPDEYVQNMVSVFKEVRRVLKDDGTLWLNLGDSYSGSGKGAYADGTVRLSEKSKKQKTHQGTTWGSFKKTESQLKPKDLVGIPWRVAFALQADGWYLRQDIIWHKPNPMPESVRDRCTKAHEYIFLLSKKAKYFFDSEAILEPAIEVQRAGRTRARGGTPLTAMKKDRTNSGGFTPRYRGSGNKERKSRPGQFKLNRGDQCGSIPWNFKPVRNKRSVWTITTRPLKGAHFATFPPDLIEPCVLAGSRPGDTVLDPFFGAGTTGLVAKKHGRNFIGIELNAEYVEIAKKRIEAFCLEPQTELKDFSKC